MHCRSLVLVLVLVLVAGCWTGGPATAPTPEFRPARSKVPEAAPLEVELHARPLTLTMAERAAFQIKFVVTNVSKAPLDPQLDFCDLLINGEPSVIWANTVGNGARDPEWYAMPPGAQISREWPLGETLFEKPGDYTLVLRVSGILSAPLRVHLSS